MMRSFYALMVISLIGFQLSAQPIVSGFNATTQSGNVLRYDVSFSTSQAARGFVEYVWFDGADTLHYKTGVTDSATTHHLTVLGLASGAAYRLRAVVYDATGCYAADWDSITVAPLPSIVSTANILQVAGNGALPNGFILSNTSIANPNRFLQIHDRKGHLVWYEKMPGDGADSLDGPCQHFSYDKSTGTIFLTDCAHVTALDLERGTMRIVDLTNLAPRWMPHHDIYQNSVGNWLILASKSDTINKSAVGGDSNAIVVGPGVFEVNATGNIVWSWSAFDHLNPLTSPGPGGRWVSKFGAQAIDWLGANSVMQDGDGNPMLSFGGSSQVIKVARSGANVVWTCGLDGDIEVLPPDTFFHQHGLRPSRPGYYLTFDNQGLGGLSRAVEWWIDFAYIHARMQISWQHTLPIGDFSPEDGNLERLPNGDFFIAASGGRHVSQISHGGTELWSAKYDSSFYRAYLLDDLYHRIHPQYLGDTVVCAIAGAIRLVANPSGGIWSGPFVVGDSFNAAAAFPGYYPLVYKWGPEELHFEIKVDASPNCGVGVGAQHPENLEFTVFPNPFTAKLNFELSLNRQESLVLEVFTLDGRRVLEQHLGRVDVGKHIWTLNSNTFNAVGGTYLVRLHTLSGKNASKILIQN